MTHHENRAVLDRMVSAMINGDVESATAELADDAVVEWPQSGERISGRQACFTVYSNYPGGPPHYEVKRVSGGGDTFFVEAVGDYGGQKVYMTSVVEFRNGKIARQTEYFADPFEPPAWRMEWVDRIEQA